MNPFDIVLPIGIIIPLLAGTTFFFFGWLFEAERETLVTLAVLVTLVTLIGQIAIGAGVAISTTAPSASLINWSPLPNAQVQIAFRADLLSLYFGLPLSVLFFLISLYLVTRQPDCEEGEGIIGGRLYGLMLITEGAILAAIYSSDLIWMYGWGEMVGLCLYLLVGPGLRGASSEPSSFHAFATNVMGGFLILAPLLVAVSRNGGVALYNEVSPSSFEVIFFALVIAGVSIKTAQFPFHTWLGSINRLQGSIYAFIAGGAIFPLAVYIPARLQSIVGDRFNFFKEVSPALLPVGAFTILACSWLAIRETGTDRFTQRISLLITGQFGFVLIALGLDQPTAASWLIFTLTIAGPVLWLCADQMQIENIPLSKPLVRPSRYRNALVGLYLVGAFTLAGFPLSPVYGARWQVFEGLLAGGNRFYAGIAAIGLVVTIAVLAQTLIIFTNQPGKTVSGRNRIAWVNLAVPGVMALGCLVTGVYPNVIAEWIAQLPARIDPTGPQKLPAAATTNGGWFGFLVALGLLVAFWLFQSNSKVAVTPAYNGGLLYGQEEEEARKQRISKKTALKLYEEKLPSGFDDDFFKIGFEAPKPVKIGPEPRLTIADYFGPITIWVRNLFNILNTSKPGGFLGNISLKVLRFLVGWLEWITEKFYAALVVLVVLLLIFLLTR